MSNLELKLPEDNPSVMRHIGNALMEIANDQSTDKTVTLFGVEASEYLSTPTVDEIEVVEITGDQKEVTTKAFEDKDDVLPLSVKDEDAVFEKVAEAFGEKFADDQMFYGFDKGTEEKHGFATHGQLMEWIREASEQRIKITDEQYRDKSFTLPPDEVDTELPPPPPADTSGADVDSASLPWDGRIHSKNKTTVKDGTWKLKRKPADKDETQWLAFIDQVRAECTQAMSGEPLPPAEDGTDLPPPPPPAEDGTDLPPPPPPADSDVTFVKFMQLVTANASNESVKKALTVLNSHGVTSIPMLNTARPDLIPTAYAELKASLGV